MTNAAPVEVLGENSVTGLVIRDTVTGETSTLDVTGMFVAIGQTRAANSSRDRSTSTTPDT